MISGSLRFLVNVESLNGVETVGNLSKHRTAAVVVKTDKGYAVRYVPAVSGESIAHAYQQRLADLATAHGVPVSQLSKRGEFLKFTDDGVLKQEGVESPKSHEDALRFETEVMLKDVVTDVGGFLYAGKPPVRRTSRFKVGYMIPAVGMGDVPAQLEAQFHVRYATNVADNQKIYNTEVGSALYTLSFILDDDLIAVPSTHGDHDNVETLKGQKAKRRELAVKALLSVFTLDFGAKRSRFLPQAELVSGVVVKTDFPFVPEPASYPSYISATVERAVKTMKVLGKQERGMKVLYMMRRDPAEAKPSLLGGINMKEVYTPEDILMELV